MLGERVVSSTTRSAGPADRASNWAIAYQITWALERSSAETRRIASVRRKAVRNGPEFAGFPTTTPRRAVAEHFSARPFAPLQQEPHHGREIA